MLNLMAHGWGVIGPPDSMFYIYSVAATRTMAITQFLQMNEDGLARNRKTLGDSFAEDDFTVWLPNVLGYIRNRQNAWRRWKHRGYRCCKVVISYYP